MFGFGLDPQLSSSSMAGENADAAQVLLAVLSHCSVSEGEKAL